MDLREIIGWIFEGIGAIILLIGVFIVLFQFLLLCLYVLAPRWVHQTPYYGVMTGLIVVTAFIPCLIVGGVMALSGYIMARVRTVAAQRISQDITVRKPKQEISSPPIQRVIVCPNCGGANHMANVFCRYCGQRLKKE